MKWRYLGEVATVLFATLVVLSSNQAKADVIDLTTEGAYGDVNGTYFYQYDPEGSTGTGRIDSFLRIQGPASGGIEEGYNTVGTLEYETKDATSLQVWELSEITFDGIEYYGFLLDINESGGAKRFVSLDEVRVYVEDTGSLDDSQFGTPVYDLDAGGDNYVLLDTALGSGSGDGDMLMLVPSDLFGEDQDKYVYLYSKLGVNEIAESGFEEWAVNSGEGLLVTPEPTTLVLLATGTLLLLRRRRT